MSMSLEEAIKASVQGKSVLLIGAGFSYSAKNLFNKTIGQAQELIKELCNDYDIDYEENYSLGDVTSYILENDVEKTTEITQDIILKLQNKYQTSHEGITDSQKIIASLPWIRIYTTNYDDVFENAYKKNFKTNIPIFVSSDDTSKAAKKSSIIHLNGYIRNLTPEKLNSEFKLTDFSYWQTDFKREKMFSLLKQDLDNAKSIIYIGTSLKYDFDISTLLNAEEYKSKTFFIDKLDEKIKIYDTKKQHLGTQLKIGIEGFAEKIHEKKEGFSKENNLYELKCLKKIKIDSNNYKENNIQHLWDLLLYGNIDKEILQKNLYNDDYIISRTEIKNIKPKKYRVINVHSNLGNGKSLAILKQAYLWSKDYDVYVLDNLTKYLYKDLNEISKNKNHKILIIENYTLYFEFMEKLAVFLDESYTIIITSRSYINEQYERRIPEILGITDDKIQSVNLNYLNNTEVQKFSKLITKLNIAEILDSSGSNIKKEIANKQQIASILLAIIKSKSISKKVDFIYNSIALNSTAKKILCMTMVNNFTTLNLSFSDLSVLLDVTTRDIENIRNENVKELISVGDGNLRLQSPVFSQYLISKQDLDLDLVEVMKQMLINADKLIHSSAKRISLMLISQSNIKLIFSGLDNEMEDNSSINSSVLKYYDEIIEVRQHEKNIFFWLQYAIAAMNSKQYDRADNYLQGSYKLAKKKGNSQSQFDTFQIDTQSARLILEKSINGLGSGTITELITANKNLKSAISQRKKQERLAYKQMRLYLPFLKKNIKSFSRDDLVIADKIISNNLSDQWVNYDGRENNEIKDILINCKSLILKAVTKL